MESLVFAANAVLPIIIMVALGWFLKKAGIVGKDFVKVGNRLVFKIFLPVMLFTNVYKIESLKNVDFGHVWYSLFMIVLVFAIAVFVAFVTTEEGAKRGSLAQGIFRSNYALIGIPVAGSLFGEEGIAAAAVLSAFAIPLFNIFAVSILIFFGKKGEKIKIGEILLGIVKNPLIQGVAVGFVALLIREIFVSADIAFRLFDIAPVEKVADYISSMSTPFSLIVLGADFEFSAISAMKKEIITGTAMRCIAVPIICIGAAAAFFHGSFSGAQFAAIAALFTAPVAVSSVPMAQEMGGDPALSGQIVVWTTVCSAGTIFLASFVLKLMGIF